MLEHALALHRLGCNVIPLRYDHPDERKKPLHGWKRWEDERQTEPWIATTWGRHPQAGIALVCGAISGVVAVDLDSLEAVTWAQQNLPPTPWMVKTGKGQHWFYRHPGVPVRNRAKLKGMKLDIRGDGGYVVAPPSLHPSDVRYAWVGTAGPGEAPSVPSGDLPLFLPAWIDDPAPAPTAPLQPELPARATTSSPGPGGPVDQLMAEKRAAGWMAKRDGAVQGSGGDQHTYNTAATLVRDFGLNQSAAWRLLKEWNAKCSPHWSEPELWKKLKSALASGQASAGSKEDRAPGADKLIEEARKWGDEAPAAKGSKAKAAPATRAAQAGPVAAGQRQAAMAAGAEGDDEAGPPEDDDPRKLVFVDGDPQEVYKQALHALAGHKDVYVTAGGLCRVSEKGIVPMGTGSIMRALVDVVRFGKSTRWDVKLVPAPDWLLRMLVELPQEDLGGFRQLEGVARTPFWTESGKPVSQPGYNPESKTVLLDPPAIVSGGWASSAEAMQWLVDEVLSDFPFANKGELANYLGALLVPIVRRMINGPVPLHNIEAARRGTGKSKLAEVLLATHGLPGEMGPLPPDDAEAEKRVLAVLRSGTSVRVWDNVQHYVSCPALAVLLTVRVYTGRLLQQTQELSFPVNLLNLMTANNARFNDDITRRTVRIRLVSKEEFPEDRQGFKHDDLVAWVTDNRGLVLSALWQAVNEWVEAGKPAPGAHLRMGSYESFVRVIGGILWHAGIWDWLENLSTAREEQSGDADEWPAFLQAWWNQYAIGNGTTVLVSAKQLFDLAEPEGLLLEARGSGHESAQLQRLSRAVRGRRQAVIAGYEIDAVKDPHSKALRFKLTRADLPRQRPMF